jgi:hypothetical protein
MATPEFALAGDDPLLSADQLTGNVDPAFSSAPPTDPLLLSTFDPSLDSIPPIYGPSTTQLGANPNSPAITGNTDPSAFNSHPSTSVSAGSSILDSILKLGNIGVAAANIATGGNKNSSVTGAGSKAANQLSNSKTVAQSQTGSIFAAGNGGFFMIFVIGFFILMVAWAEWGSGT